MTDFKKLLKNPPKKYRPVPFWSWNEKLSVDETREQIRQMNEAGLGGYFMHARGGLQTEYLSDEWFDNVSAALEEGESAGMLSWGYDENGWPSGFGNGAVNGLGLKYQQKYLRCEETDAPVQNEFTLANVRVDGKTVHCYFDVNPYYVDTLNPEVTEEFLKSTHEKYRERLGSDFKKLKGFFTDEPQASRNGIPWSFNLEKEYERIYGESIREHLPKLFYRTEGFEEFRFRYWKLVRDLFTDSYMRVIGKWCKKNGCSLTGHMVLEEGFYEHILASGSCTPSYEFMDIPGMDHLCRQQPSVQTEMQLVSAANQLGKRQILSETFAACGWNVSFADMRRIYEHQLVHGINLLCQHLEGYSLRGIRKRDYPASIFRHQPWWKDYKIFNDMVSRIGMLLSEGEVRFPILVLHTIESGWLLTDNRPETDAYAEKLALVMDALEDAQLQYHLGESRIMERHGSVKDGKLCIGTQSYSLVIVPPAKCLDENTFGLLCEFKKQGGSVIFTEEIPEYINGIRTEKVREFAKDCVTADSAHIAGFVPDDLRLFSLDAAPGDKCRLRSTVRYFEKERMTMYYVCNFGDKEASVMLRAQGRSAAIFDAAEGVITHARYEKRDEELEISGKIPAGTGVIFFVYEDRDAAAAEPKAQVGRTDISDKLRGDWQVSHSDLNSLTLDFCGLTVNGDQICERMPVSDVQEMLCAYGRAVRAELDFRFDIRELAFGSCFLALETPEIFDISLNGREVSKVVTGYVHDPCFKTIDIYDYLREGENVLRLACDFEQSGAIYRLLEKIKEFESNKNNLTYDMEVEAVYLKGDFGVFTDSGFRPAENGSVKSDGGFYLAAAPETLTDGCIETQGYPFFAGSITLSKRISLTNEEAKTAAIAFACPPSIVTDIRINGKSAGKLLWQPYCLDISGLVREGENEIQITLTGSLRNLLGPFHIKEGETFVVLPFYFFRQTGIWGWGDGRNPKWDDAYSFVQNGLFFK
ncbi:MAG: hypothetical protein IJU01_01135 [Lachnospiraceae bacterium]|nr:hypothetical protein [Lachnospiraceae bacterium]